MRVLKADPESSSGKRVLRFLGALARGLIRMVGMTLRFDVVEGKQRMDELFRTARPVVYVVWHNRAIVSACWLSSPALRKQLKLAIMASQSRDGQIVANITRPWGVHIVRGSATRGGQEALRKLHRVVTQEKVPVMLAPDGPKGPKFQFKLGVAVLAQMANIPVVPIGLVPQESWRLRSWDRLYVPRLFSRVTVAMGEPIEVPRGASAEELEQIRLRLEAALTRVNQRAEEAADVRRQFELELEAAR